MRDAADWLEGLVPALERSRLLVEVRRLECAPPWIAAYAGVAPIGDGTIELSIQVHQDHPAVLPHVCVTRGHDVERIPHVADDGTVCYYEHLGLSSSLWRPLDVVIDAVAQAQQTLDRGLCGRNLIDFVAEAEWYWSRHGAGRLVLSFVRPSHKLKTLEVLASGEGALYLTDSIAQVTAFLPALAIARPNDRGLYVPLESSVHQAGLDPRAMVDVAKLRAIVQRHSSPENQRILAARLHKAPALRWLVIGIPRGSHDRALLGVDLGRVVGPHPLSRKTGPSGVCRPFSIHRLDHEHLVIRGGATMSLTDRKVAIIGCGAVGGHVASTLARTGVGELLLIDPEALEIGNLYRHALGRPHLGMPKALMLAATLRAEVPYLEVRADIRRIQDGLRAEPSLLDRFDVVVNAVGDVNVSRWLNLELHRGARARIVHTWLEPLGLGGHALLAAASGRSGCYECLFVGPDGGEALHSRSDLAAPGQTFHTGDAACGGTYTPYADLDARRTAELAARTAVDALHCGSPVPRLFTWKSDGRAFRAAGFVTSRRFELSGHELDAGEHELFVPRCPVCGGSP